MAEALKRRKRNVRQREKDGKKSRKGDRRLGLNVLAAKRRRRESNSPLNSLPSLQCLSVVSVC